MEGLDIREFYHVLSCEGAKARIVCAVQGVARLGLTGNTLDALEHEARAILPAIASRLRELAAKKTF